MDGKPFVPDPAHSAQWNCGAYLVNSLGHCAECHSPRNFLGGIITAQRFAGGPDPEGEGWVPNITQKGLADWSAKDIAYFLETGQTPDGDSAGGSMVRVIRNTSQLSPEDRAAIADYSSRCRRSTDRRGRSARRPLIAIPRRQRGLTPRSRRTP